MPFFADICSHAMGFQGDLLRNIASIRDSQHLFDDLSDDPDDLDLAVTAADMARPESEDSLLTRPFDYGAAISYSFQSAHWQASRYSDGSSFGVWYGSPELETTVYETVFHWHRFVMDSFSGHGSEITAERRVFKAACDALLIDLRGKETGHPELVSRTSYAFTQSLGAWLFEQGQNGLLAASARCDGTNAAIFRAERLSNVRDVCFLTYRLRPDADSVTVERRPGQTWLTITPSSLA